VQAKKKKKQKNKKKKKNPKKKTTPPGSSVRGRHDGPLVHPVSSRRPQPAKTKEMRPETGNDLRLRTRREKKKKKKKTPCFFAEHDPTANVTEYHRRTGTQSHLGNHTAAEFHSPPVRLRPQRGTWSEFHRSWREHVRVRLRRIAADSRNVGTTAARCQHDPHALRHRPIDCTSKSMISRRIHLQSMPSMHDRRVEFTHRHTPK